jgi:glutaredoxin
MRLLVLAFALLPAIVAAQYKWIDANGRVTYGDNPPREAKNVERMRGAVPDADPVDALPFEVRRAVASFPLTLYTAPDCAACSGARELLRARGAPYSEVTVATLQDREAFLKMNLGNQVPVLMVGRQGLKEFDPDLWHRTLDTAGYPRNAVLPRSWSNPAPRSLVAPAAPDAATSAATGATSN